MQEAAQPWEPCFVPQETVQATVRYPLSRMPTLLEHDEDRQQLQNLQVLTDGARPDAPSGGTKAVVTTQSANRRG